MPSPPQQDGSPMRASGAKEHGEQWLVICHEATNTGAPRMLLEILRGMRRLRGAELRFEILISRGGPLEHEFAGLGPTHVLAHPFAAGSSLFAGVFRKFLDRPYLQPRRFGRWMKRNRGRTFDLIYNNTTTNAYVVPAVRAFGCPILTHVHELGYAMQRFNTPAALAQTLDNSDRFLAVSTAAAADLIERGAKPDRITVTPNFLTELPLEPTHETRLALRKKLNLPTDAQVIIGCGYVDWLKGTDLFVEAAAAVARLTSKNLRWVWLGRVADRRYARRLRRRLRELNLENIFHFVGAVPDTAPWFTASDLVLVSSRAESFSLVALEAGALSRPVLAFSAARGLLELLGDEPGLLVSKLDSEEMAAAVLKLLERPNESAAIGKRLRTRIAANYMAGPRIQAIAAVARDLVDSGCVRS